MVKHWFNATLLEKSNLWDICNELLCFSFLSSLGFSQPWMSRCAAFSGKLVWSASKPFIFLQLGVCTTSLYSTHELFIILRSVPWLVEIHDVYRSLRDLSRNVHALDSYPNTAWRPKWGSAWDYGLNRLVVFIIVVNNLSVTVLLQKCYFLVRK